MAKAIKKEKVEKTTKPKKQTSLTEPIVEETKETLPEHPIIETPEEEPIVETPIVEETVVEPEPIVEAPPMEVVVDKVVYTAPTNDERSMEEKIVAFLDSREGTDIKLNDFLKSLFGVPKFNEPPNWLSQGASKQLRVLLGDMQTKGLISISNNMHTKLGTFYYEGNSPVTLYHSLNTVPLVAKK